MSLRKSIAALSAAAATAAMALPVASATAAPTAPSVNPVAATSTAALCGMLGGQAQGAQLFGNPILTARLQQTSGYMNCGAQPAAPVFPGIG